MPITINGTTGISGVDGSAGAPALIGSDADTGLVFAAGQVSASLNGAAANVPLVQGTAQNSTSGTSIDFTSIPSWVKRITVAFNGVSLSGASSPLVQIGTGGSPTTSGYTAGTIAVAAAANTPLTSTAGFPVFANTASYALNGVLTLVNVSGNLWVASGSFFNVATTAYGAPSAGSVTLAGALNMIRITTVNGTDTFDAGSINIMYE